MPGEVNPDTNFKVIDKRSPETQARVAEMAGNHTGDVNEMVLKPCPFCGGKASIDYMGSDDCYPECENCSTTGKLCNTEPEAIAAWNRRVPMPILVVKEHADGVYRYPAHSGGPTIWDCIDIAKMQEKALNDFAASWKHTPEPGTSVVRWVRYDGTEGTLPEAGQVVLLCSPSTGGKTLPVTTIFDSRNWTLNMTTPDDPQPFYLMKPPETGDCWCRLPEPPEVMG